MRCSRCSWAQCARKTLSGLNVSHWAAAASCHAPVVSLWHRCYTCPAAEKFRRRYCENFDLEKWLMPMPLSGPVGCFGHGLCWRTPPLRRTYPGTCTQRTESWARRASRRISQRRALEALGARRKELGGADRRNEGDGNCTARCLASTRTSGRSLLVVPVARDGRGRGRGRKGHLLHGLCKRAAVLDEPVVR